MRDHLRRPRVTVNPRELKKSSDIRRAAASPVKIAGERTPTETGYVVLGHHGKNFETFYEVMLPGTGSAFYLHEKKDRAIWLIAGQGFVTTQKGDGPQTTRRIVAGDHIDLERGTTYRISTTATERLEFFVTQSSKYSSALQIVAPSDAVKAPTKSDLKEPTLDERLGTVAPTAPRRRRSKAAQQQTRSHRKSPQVEETYSIVSEPPDPRRVGTLAGVNTQPTGGRFDDAGAG